MCSLYQGFENNFSKHNSVGQTHIYFISILDGLITSKAFI